MLHDVEVVAGYEQRVAPLKTVMQLWMNPPSVPAERALWLASSASDGKGGLEVNVLGPGMMLGSPDCTPGYYNNEGQPIPERAKYNVGYPAGATAYFEYIKEWRESGEFDGIEFR